MYIYDTYPSVPKYTTVFILVCNQTIPYILEQVGTYVRVFCKSIYRRRAFPLATHEYLTGTLDARLASCWSDQRPNDEEDRRRHRQ